MSGDIDIDRLRQRVIEPYEKGESFTVGGKTFTASDPPRIEVYEGPSREDLSARGVGVITVGLVSLGTTELRDVTDDYVTMPFGGAASFSNPQRSGREGANTIFVVHGRNLDVAERVARRVEKAVGEKHPVVLLGEQSDQGQTVIEKLERAAEAVLFAIVVLTADDVGRLASAGEEALQPRARQNVVFELGYFTSLLGRSHVAPVVQAGIELPSDFLGVLYIDHAEADWDIRLARRLREAGLEADLNRLA